MIELEEVLQRVRKAVKEVWDGYDQRSEEVIKTYQPELDNGTRAILTFLKNGEDLRK